MFASPFMSRGNRTSTRQSIFKLKRWKIILFVRVLRFEIRLETTSTVLTGTDIYAEIAAAPEFRMMVRCIQASTTFDICEIISTSEVLMIQEIVSRYMDIMPESISKHYQITCPLFNETSIKFYRTPVLVL